MGGLVRKSLNVVSSVPECGLDILRRGRSRSCVVVEVALRPGCELMVAGLSVLSGTAADKMIADVNVDKKVDVEFDDNLECDSEGLSDDVNDGESDVRVERHEGIETAEMPLKITPPCDGEAGSVLLCNSVAVQLCSSLMVGVVLSSTLSRGC